MKGSRRWLGVLGLGVWAWQGVAWADGLAQLHEFLSATQRGQANFEQRTLKGDESTGAEISRGIFQFSRPGKFRWEYRTPYPQTLVADGHDLWIWDPDLQQATRKPLDQSLGATPAALLAGSNALETAFALENDGEQGGVEWVKATPKGQDSGFSSVKMGFQGDQLARMELRDNFGHHMIIRFTDFERVPKFAPDTFLFKPPVGADVIQ